MVHIRLGSGLAKLSPEKYSFSSWKEKKIAFSEMMKIHSISGKEKTISQASTNERHAWNKNT